MTSFPTATAPKLLQGLKEKPVTLLLTDIVMPEMDGIELAKRAAELNPEMKIMFITGIRRCRVAALFGSAAAGAHPFKTDPSPGYPRSGSRQDVSRLTAQPPLAGLSWESYSPAP